MAINNKKNRFWAALSSANKLTGQNRLPFVTTAVIVCGILFFCYFYFAKNGMGMMDESFYLTVVDRLIKGDRLIVDEWHLTQLTAIFLYLPYKAFLLVTGSTEGVILYMRHVYTLVLLLTYWYIIIKLRKTPLQAVASAFSFCSFIPMGIHALNYYTLPPILMLGVCFILTGKRGRMFPVRAVFAGILISATVLLVPGFALVWIVYSVVVFVRVILKRRGINKPEGYDFVLDLKVWLYLLVGVLASAVMFLAFLQIHAGLKNVFEALPNLFTDSEYNVIPANTGEELIYYLKNMFFNLSKPFTGNVILFFVEKTTDCVRINNFFLCCAAFAVACSAFKYNRSKEGFNRNKKRILAILAGSIAVAMYVFSVIYKSLSDNIPPFVFPVESPIVISWITLIYYILSEKKNKKAFFFWITGVVLSLSKDFLSDVSYGCGLVLCVVAWVQIAPKMFTEVFTDYDAAIRFNRKTRGKQNKTIKHNNNYLRKTEAVFCFFCCGLAIMTAFWAFGNIFYACRYSTGGSTYKTRKNYQMIERGPYSGVVCASELKETNDALLDDIELASSLGEGSVYIMGLVPFGYLYADSDYPVYSTYFVPKDAVSREEVFWKSHPEKRPKVIYNSVKNSLYFTEYVVTEEEFEKLPEKEYRDFGWFEGTAIKGKAGLIIKIEKWK